MRTLTHTVAGTDCRIHFPERREDVAGFADWLAADRVLCVDTETTGLDIYSRGYALRLVQIGDRDSAWVLRTDLFADVIQDVLSQDRNFTMHNAAFDLQVLDRHLGVDLHELGSRTWDTRIMAHLIDPRTEGEGGAGLGLKPLSAIYVDPSAPDTQGDLTAVFRSLGLTKATGFAGIPIDHETYVRYAGLDVILGRRLYDELSILIDGLGLSDLCGFEHHLQVLLCDMQRRGIKLDVPYVESLSVRLGEEEREFAAVAKRYGVENPNSTKQVAASLLAMGEELRERTGSGAPKVDRAVLLPLADLDQQWQRIGARTPNPLADAILRSKRAGKWRETYADQFMALKDEDDRIHPFIGGLQARTARMSISRPPLQQLPSGDWAIRRAFVADPGNLFISADYDQVEMRILAAEADVKAMKHAIATGVDLHDYTAELMFGPDFTKFQRKLSKGAGFAKVYGGGKTTIARSTGASLDVAGHAVSEYDRVYPEVRKFSSRLQRQAQYGKREVVTRSGRHLPLDKDRLYAACNYVIQSTARDVMAQAIVDMYEAGLGSFLSLPIHDEVLAQAPVGQAEDVAKAIGEIMSRDFMGVPLTATGDVTGKNWGAAYGSNPNEGWNE